MPCTCIGVGLTIPFCSKPERMLRGNFISANDFIGGGISSPSTNILNFLRTRLWRISDIPRIYLGGFQLKNKYNDIVYIYHKDEYRTSYPK